jgi:glutamate dehydrogenase
VRPSLFSPPLHTHRFPYTVIDGSGTIHDPEGLDRTELVRLAKARLMVSNFDRSKLSKEGYLILVEDRDITLPRTFSPHSSTLIKTDFLPDFPDGEVVVDGTDFRNGAHLRYKSDILVPCGGRPESVNLGNVSKLWDSEGVPSFKYIVEGANLFISPQARLQLEKRGVVLFVRFFPFAIVVAVELTFSPRFLLFSSLPSSCLPLTFLLPGSEGRIRE